MNLVDRSGKPPRLLFSPSPPNIPTEWLASSGSSICPRIMASATENVDLNRLGAILAVAYEREFRDFASLLLLENLEPRRFSRSLSSRKSWSTGPLRRSGSLFLRTRGQGRRSLSRPAQDL